MGVLMPEYDVNLYCTVRLKQEKNVRILADDTVETATLDRRRYPHALPNDPLYTGQWYLQSNATNPAAINAEQAWNTTTGSNGVVIADIDTGVRYEHPDLGRAQDGGRVLPGYDFITDSRVAGDGDGRDADPTDTGDFLTSAEAATPFFNNCGGASGSFTTDQVQALTSSQSPNPFPTSNAIYRETNKADTPTWLHCNINLSCFLG